VAEAGAAGGPARAAARVTEARVTEARVAEARATEARAAEARAYGLAPGELRDWAPLAPVEVHWAAGHGLAPATAVRWARAGLRAGDTVRAVALGMVPEDVRPWADAGFAPSDAVEAREAGIPLATAAAWREAGFILPDAALLIRDHWTLSAAVRARYAGIPEADWPTGGNPGQATAS
jgi:hypothetical protein